MKLYILRNRKYNLKGNGYVQARPEVRGYETVDRYLRISVNFWKNYVAKRLLKMF